MIRPGSCSSGLRSAPSIGNQGSERSNGLEVNSMKAWKPTAIMPITDSTRTTMGSGTLRLNRPTRAVQPPSIQPHSNREPSWPPQIADSR